MPNIESKAANTKKAGHPVAMGRSQDGLKTKARALLGAGGLPTALKLTEGRALDGCGSPSDALTRR